MSIERSKCPTCGGPTVVLAGGEHVHANEQPEALAEVQRLREALAVYAAGTINGVTIPPGAREKAKRACRPETTEEFVAATENAERTEAMAQGMQRGRSNFDRLNADDR